MKQQTGPAASLDRRAGPRSRERASFATTLGVTGTGDPPEIRTSMNSGRERVRGHEPIRTSPDARTWNYGVRRLGSNPPERQVSGPLTSITCPDRMRGVPSPGGHGQFLGVILLTGNKRVLKSVVVPDAKGRPKCSTTPETSPRTSARMLLPASPVPRGSHASCEPAGKPWWPLLACCSRWSVSCCSAARFSSLGCWSSSLPYFALLQGLRAGGKAATGRRGHPGAVEIECACREPPGWCVPGSAAACKSARWVYRPPEPCTCPRDSPTTALERCGS